MIEVVVELKAHALEVAGAEERVVPVDNEYGVLEGLSDARGRHRGL